MSSMKNGCLASNGLAAKGVGQVQESADELICALKRRRTPLHNGPGGIIVVASPFRRTQETASEFCGVWSKMVNASAAHRTSDNLRERDFGCYELTDDSNYAGIWARDALEGVPMGCGGKTGYACSQYATVETPSQVWERVAELIEELESFVVEPTTIILVSHGDTLQITQTAFSGKPLSQHRCLPPLKQAEWRVVNKGSIQRGEYTSHL